MDFESGSANTSVSYTEGSNGDIEHFLWKNAGNVQNVDISVLKVGDKFYFYDNNAEAVSASPLNSGSSVTVAGFDPTGSGNPVIYSYTFINGRMIIASGFQEVTILSYDEASDIVSSITSPISIRDTFGIWEDVLPDVRPITITSEHIYNLANQGWLGKIDVNVNNTVWHNLDTISVARWGANRFLSAYPSNSDVLSSFKTTDSTVLATIGLFNPDEMLKTTFGTGFAAKGNTIFENMFIRGTIRADIVTNRTGATVDDFTNTALIDTAVSTATLPLPHSTESTQGGISTVTAYSGRLVYTVIENGRTNPDDESPAFGDMIFYSQSTDGLSGLTKCYTRIDPTSADDFALLDTDGGYITLSGVGTINDLEVLGNSLFVFADNGVWQINGGNSLFTPSNINIHRLTNVGNINRKGVVISENRLFYLSDAGLYEVVMSDVDPSLPATVNNISQSTIQDFLDSLSVESKQKAISTFDRFANQVKWLLSSGSLPDLSYYDVELVLDLNLNAFSINRIKSVSPLSGDTPYVIGYLSRPSAIIIDTTKQIVVTGDNVIVGVDDVKITFRSIDSSVNTSNKYWVSRKVNPTTLNISVSEYKDLQFRDWGSIANTSSGFGEDAYAFMLTGYLTGGDSSTNKRVTYITTHFRRTERIFTAVADGFEPDNPSSCILTAQWEWTSSANAGRWSNPQQIYRLPRTFIPDVGTFDYGHEVVTTKSKLRGKGKALSLLFQTEPLKDCHLYGWSYELNVEVSV